MMSFAHTFGGRPDIARTYFEQSMRLSPREMFSEDYQLLYAFMHFATSDYPKCLQSAQMSHRGRPHHPYPIIMSLVAAGHLGDDEAQA